jgi:hypothetical protein
VHRDVDVTSAQCIAYRADKDASAADLRQMTLVDITGGRNADKTRISAVDRQRRGDLVRLCPSESGSTCAQPNRPGQSWCTH